VRRDQLILLMVSLLLGAHIMKSIVDNVRFHELKELCR